MKKKGPTISTMFFLIAVELLFFCFVVSILVWLRNTMPTWLSNDNFEHAQYHVDIDLNWANIVKL